jgi:hypothetical protein
MSEPTVQTYQTRAGPMLALRTDFYMTRSFELYGEYCPEEWRMLKQVIRSGMTVVEAGANMGAHSVNMARACAPGAFYAFEPQPRIFQILCANLALNDIGNAIAYPEGCGEAKGRPLSPCSTTRSKATSGDCRCNPRARSASRFASARSTIWSFRPVAC